LSGGGPPKKLQECTPPETGQWLLAKKSKAIVCAVAEQHPTPSAATEEQDNDEIGK
jgi:hypothetical protein